MHILKIYKYAIAYLCKLFAAKMCAILACIFYKIEIRKISIMHIFDDIKRMQAVCLYKNMCILVKVELIVEQQGPFLNYEILLTPSSLSWLYYLIYDQIMH